MHTYGISSGRLDRVLKKKSAGLVMEKDSRGKHCKQYKISQNVINDLEEFLKKLLKYRSHCKEQNDERYLAANIKKINVYNKWNAVSKEKFKESFPTYEWFLGYWKKK